MLVKVFAVGRGSSMDLDADGSAVDDPTALPWPLVLCEPPVDASAAAMLPAGGTAAPFAPKDMWRVTPAAVSAAVRDGAERPLLAEAPALLLTVLL